MGIIDDLEKGRWKNQRRNRWFFTRWMRRGRAWWLLRQRRRKAPAPAKKVAGTTPPVASTRVPRALVVIAIVGAVVVGWVTWYVGSLFEGISWPVPSAPSKWALAWLAAIIVAAFLVWFFWSPTRRNAITSTTSRVPLGKLVRGAAWAAVLVFLGVHIYDWYTEFQKPKVAVVTPKPPSVDELYPRSIVANREWSEWRYMPPGHHTDADRDEDVAFEVQVDDEDSEPYTFERGDVEEVHLPKWRRIRFRVIDDEVETVSISFTYTPLAEAHPKNVEKVSPPATPEPEPEQQQDAPDQKVEGVFSISELIVRSSSS